jgi:hypothetical protein
MTAAGKGQTNEEPLTLPMKDSTLAMVTVRDLGNLTFCFAVVC